MIVEELVARLGFSVEGLEKLRRAAQMFQQLQRAIAAFAMAIAKRLGRVAVILARVTGRLAKFGASFIARSALITGAATAAQAALMKLAAGFAKARQASIDQAFVNGIDPRQLALIENLMVRVGAGAKDAQKWIGEFAQKVRGGVREGGDWSDALAKQGVRLKDAKGRAKSYSQVIDDVLKAADKIKDSDKRREFLTEALEGAPDELIAKLLQATSAFKTWQKLVADTRKSGGNLSPGDILNAGDITDALGRLGVALKGFTDAIGSGLMAVFASEFRKLGDAVASVATDENRDRLRSLAGTIANFLVRVREGGFIVLSKVGDAISSIVTAVGNMDAATGGKLRMLGEALSYLVLGLGVGALAAGHPLVVISAAITGLLALLAEFQRWNSGDESPLSGFFSSIASAANTAKEAVVGLAEALKSIPGFNFLGQQQAPDTAKEGGRKAGEMIQGLIKKQAEISINSVAPKVAADRAASTVNNNQTYEQNNNFGGVTVNASGLEGVAAAAERGLKAAAGNIRMNTATSGAGTP